jgi:hypothetical protein
MISRVEHSGVKGMKWDKRKEVDLSPERQIFNQIMMGQYKGELTPEEQAKFVADRFSLEQKVRTDATSGGKDRYEMSNDELDTFIKNLETPKKKVKELSKKKVASGKKRATKIIDKNSKKKVPSG